MHVLIIGATGGTGRELVAQALERGHDVTAFVRRPSQFKVSHGRLRVVQGDVMEAASLGPAVAGQDAVLCALGHKRWLYPTRILSQGTAHIIAAMQQAGVRRLVCETSLGVGDSRGRMGLYYTLFVIPFILPFYYWDKGRQEQVVRASDRDWVIVRPGALNNRRAQGGYRHGAGLGSHLWTVGISRADTAAFMLDQVTSDEYLRATPAVCR